MNLLKFLFTTLFFTTAFARSIYKKTKVFTKNPAKLIGYQESNSTAYGFNPLCPLCVAGISSASLIIKFDQSEPAILLFATTICKLFAKQPWTVCDGISQTFREEFFYVFRRMSDSPSKICGLLIPDCADPDDPSESGWRVKLPQRDNATRELSTSSQSPSILSTVSPSSPFPVYRMLHLSDLHIDFEYTAGAEAQCDNPVCCREKTDSPIRPAGYWGTTGQCDLPRRTLRHMLEHIRDNQWIDYIILSGDYINHVDWSYNKEEHLRVLTNISDLVKEVFPNTPTFWALGNHEGVPVNSFAPHSVDEMFWPTWLYEKFGEMNGKWTDNDQNDTVHFRGSYSQKLVDGLRIISLNTGFCETTNFFLYINQSDPDQTMAWLVGQLYQAELNGEKVQILGHIPPGDGECLEGWARNYYRVVQRFNETIVGQFFGHVHNDFFTVFYEDMHNVSSLPIGVLYAAPSVTTFTEMNPGYRIYSVNKTTFEIMNHENFYADLTKANETQAPEWKLLYSAKNAYNMTDLSPQSWSLAQQEIFKKPKMQEAFLEYATRTKPTTCVGECRRGLLCALRSGHHNETLYCPQDFRLSNRIY